MDRLRAARVHHARCRPHAAGSGAHRPRPPGVAEPAAEKRSWRFAVGAVRRGARAVDLRCAAAAPRRPRSCARRLRGVRSRCGARGAHTGIPAASHALGRQPADFFRMPVTERLAGVWRRDVDGVVRRPVHDATRTSTSRRRRCEMRPSRIRAVRVYQRPTPRTDADAAAPGVGHAAAARPLAYVTLGTVAFEAVHSLRAVIAGLARLDMDVLVTVGPNGDVASLGTLPKFGSRRAVRAPGRAAAVRRRLGAPLRERHDARFAWLAASPNSRSRTAPIST